MLAPTTTKRITLTTHSHIDLTIRSAGLLLAGESEVGLFALLLSDVQAQHLAETLLDALSVRSGRMNDTVGRCQVRTELTDRGKPNERWQSIVTTPSGPALLHDYSCRADAEAGHRAILDELAASLSEAG